MRSSIIKVITSLVLMICSSLALAIDTSSAEETCVDIGFKKKTEAFGNCVLELINRGGGGQEANSSGGGGSDDATCKKYGFKPNSEGYSQCRQNIDLARQQGAQQQTQYEQQSKQYQDQLAAYQKQVRQAQAQRSLDMGLRMMGGQSAQDAYLSIGTGAPVAPLTPTPSTRTYILPGGKSMNCTTNGSITNCF